MLATAASLLAVGMLGVTPLAASDGPPASSASYADEPSLIFSVVGARGPDTQADEREGGAATLAKQVEPSALAMLPDGSVLIGNTSDVIGPYHLKVLRLSSTGRLTTFARGVNWPVDIAVAADGTVLVADSGRGQVLRVASGGRVIPVAGKREAHGFGGDGGPATGAALLGPSGVAWTADGGFLIADSGNNRIRQVAPDGKISTVVGRARPGYIGDGGPAAAAWLDEPSDVATLPDGGYLISDTGNEAVRRVWPDGHITTVAGTGHAGYAGDGGAATAAELNQPTGLTPTEDGGFLVVDSRNQVIRHVGADGLISTVAGSGPRNTTGHTGDGGPALAAGLEDPEDVLETADGGLLIAEWTTVRYVMPPAGTRLAITPRFETAKASRSGYQLGYILGRPATLTLEAHTKRKVAYSTTLAGARGPGEISLTGRFTPGPYRLLLKSRSADQQITAHDHFAFLGGRLPRSWARKAAPWMVLQDRTGHCKAWSSRRTDCEMKRSHRRRCEVVTSIRLTATGDLEHGEYRCARPGHKRFLRRPRWLRHASPSPLEQYAWWDLPAPTRAR